MIVWVLSAWCAFKQDAEPPSCSGTASDDTSGTGQSNVGKSGGSDGAAPEQRSSQLGRTSGGSGEVFEELCRHRSRAQSSFRSALSQVS